MSMSMGTKIGASNAHLADALPIIRCTIDDTRMKATSRGPPVKPMAFNPSEPFTASTLPRFDQLKYATNWAATKAITIYMPIVDMLLDVISATSLSFLMVLATIPYTRPAMKKMINMMGTSEP